MYCKLQAKALLALHVYGRQTSIQAQQQCVSQHSLFYTQQLVSISMLASEIHPHTQLLFTTPLSTLPQKYTHMPNFCLLIPLVHCLRNTPTHPTSIHYYSWYIASEIHPHTQLPFTTLLSTLPQKYTHTSNFYSLLLLVHCLRNTPTRPTSNHHSS